MHEKSRQIMMMMIMLRINIYLFTFQRRISQDFRQYWNLYTTWYDGVMVLIRDMRERWLSEYPVQREFYRRNIPPISISFAAFECWSNSLCCFPMPGSAFIINGATPQLYGEWRRWQQIHSQMCNPSREWWTKTNNNRRNFLSPALHQAEPACDREHPFIPSPLQRKRSNDPSTNINRFTRANCVNNQKLRQEEDESLIFS